MVITEITTTTPMNTNEPVGYFDITYDAYLDLNNNEAGIFAIDIKCSGVGSIEYDNTVINITEKWQRAIIVVSDHAKIKITPGQYYIYEAKLENGNKSTDWTPAPEDLAEKDTVDVVYNRVSELKQTIDGFESYVRSTYVTSNKFENLVDEYESYIKQTEKEIALKVSKNSVISAINLSEETIMINSDKVNLQGYVTFSNLSTSGESVIDGGNIKANSISSEKINVAELFSKNITATGTIDGVTLKGATGEFAGKITANSGTIGRFDIEDGTLYTEYKTNNPDENPVFIYFGTDNSDGSLIKVLSRTNDGDIETLNLKYNGAIEVSNENGAAILGYTAYPFYIPSKNCYIGYDGCARMKDITAYGTIYSSDWFRSYNNTGWYNQTYGGGIFMEDATWVKVFGGKQFFGSNGIYSDRIYAGGWGDNSAERQVHASSGAGDIYLYSQAAAGGNMGLYAGGRCAVLTLTSGNTIDFSQPLRAYGGLYLYATRDADYRAVMSENGNWICTNRAGDTNSNHGSLGSSVNYWKNVYYSGSLTKISDRREKRDLGEIPLEETLTLLENIKLIKYTLKNDSEDKIQYGMYAQDVRDILVKNKLGYRMLLGINKTNGSEEDITDLNIPEENVKYALDYTQLIAPLAHGWQYHDREIEKLKSKLESAYGQIEALRDKVHELEMAS